jgi:hypothetical protein
MRHNFANEFTDWHNTVTFFFSDDGLLDLHAMQYNEFDPTFRSKMLPPTSGWPSLVETGAFKTATIQITCRENLATYTMLHLFIHKEDGME